MTIKPKSKFNSKDKGVYSIFVWKGRGKLDGHDIEGKSFSIDEALVSHHKATTGFIIENTGNEDLIVFKLFGPDINKDVPYIE